MAFRTPWGEDPVAEVSVPPFPKKRGRRPTPTAAADRDATEGKGSWLYHHLTITGPADRVAALGAGIVPWRVDGARIEEDIFNLAASQPKATRTLTIEGCRLLARQFRERVEARTARAAGLVGQSKACPFDLHSLLPVPADVLVHERTAPKAQAWMLAHWGLSDMPRQVIVRPDAKPGRRLPAGYTVFGYGFFTAGETPQVAIATIAVGWPALRFVLQPWTPSRTPSRTEA